MIRFIALLFLLITSFAIAEMGDGYKAVARIEMQNGDTLEGVLIIATAEGAVCPFYDQNGIMYIKNKHIRNGRVQLKYARVWLFGSDLFRIEAFKRPYYGSKYPGYKRVKRANLKEGQLFFVIGKSSAEYPGQASYQWNTKTDSITSGLRYEKELVYKESYEFVKEFEIYPDMEFEYDSTGKAIKKESIVINIDKIKSLELLYDIPEKWQKNIEEVGEIIKIIDYNSGCGFFGKGWYHALLDSSEQRETAKIEKFRSYKEFLLYK